MTKISDSITNAQRPISKNMITDYLSLLSLLFRKTSDLVREADTARLSGDTAYADTIYRRLARRTPKTQADYLDIALAAHRLNNCAPAINILEAGIEQYPEASGLNERYALLCAECGEIDRAIQFLRLEAQPPKTAYELLFNMKISDPTIRSGLRTALVEHCLKHGDFLTQWKFSDVLVTAGYHKAAKSLYERVSERKLDSRVDYYYAAAAKLRLSNPKAALEILEQGLREFPGAHEFIDLGFEVCVLYFDADRYQLLVESLRRDNEAPAAPNLELYRRAIRHSAPISSFLNLQSIDFKFTREEIRILEQEFLVYLEETPVDWDQSRNIMFYCQYLDTNQAFSTDIFRILLTKVSGNIERQRALQLIHKLTPPMISLYLPDAAVVDGFIQTCNSLAQETIELNDPIMDMTVQWLPWQHIFCLATPGKYAMAIAAFETLALQTWPKLNYIAAHTLSRDNHPRKSKIRIGFMVHDSMPMLSGFFSRFDSSRFDMIYMRPGVAGNSQAAKNWIERADQIVEYSDIEALEAIHTIAAQKLDILIAGPSTAAIFYPMMAKLASIHMVLLEPNWTNGLRNSDYYVSWGPAEPPNPEDFYRTAVAYLQHPPYWIESPARAAECPSDEVLADARRRLLGANSNGRIYLCANTPPKVHSEMDDIFQALLKRDPKARLVLLRGEWPPSRTLKTRLRQKLGADFEKVVFLPTLGMEDAHLLLQSIDCCLDSYPLCGMSSSFDGVMLGVPIVTLRAPIPFGAWTAAIYDYIGVTGLTARDKSDYVDIAVKLANDRQWRLEKSLEIKTKASRFVESIESSNELQHFLLEAWNRKLSGLPSANWISGRWQAA